METNGPWNWRLTSSETIKMMLVRSLPIWRWLLKIAVLFLHVNSSPPPPTHTSVCKSSHPLLVSGGIGLWTDFHRPPHQLPESKIKQTFLSSNLDCLLVFWTASGQTPHFFGNIMTSDVYTSTFPKQILLFRIFISRFPNTCETQVNGIYWNHVSYKNGLPWWLSGKESASQCRRHGFDPWSGKTSHAAKQLSPCATSIELGL